VCAGAPTQEPTPVLPCPLGLSQDTAAIKSKLCPTKVYQSGTARSLVYHGLGAGLRTSLHNDAGVHHYVLANRWVGGLIKSLTTRTPKTSWYEKPEKK